MAVTAAVSRAVSAKVRKRWAAIMCGYYDLCAMGGWGRDKNGGRFENEVAHG